MKRRRPAAATGHAHDDGAPHDRAQDDRAEADGLELVIVCDRCGQSIVLTTGAAGVVLSDRDGFLELHARCLAETRARETGAESSDFG